MNQEAKEKLIKSITTLNKKIRPYRKYGMDSVDIASLFMDVENFDISLLTKSGNITKSSDKLDKYIDSILKESSNLTEDDVVNNLIEDLNNKLIPVKDLMNETNTTTESAAVKEFMSKQDINDILSAFRQQYYDIVTAIAEEYNVSTDEAETLLQDASNTKFASGNTKNLVDRASAWGKEFRKIEKGKETTMTYRQAARELNNVSKGLYRSKAAVRKYLNGTGGMR